jgi:hypothetical protein
MNLVHVERLSLDIHLVVVLSLEICVVYVMLAHVILHLVPRVLMVVLLLLIVLRTMT